MSERPVSPMPAAPRAAAEPIRIRELRFCTPDGRDVPLSHNEGGMSKILAGERKRTNTWVEIQFEPWQRHHRVREFSERPDNKSAKLLVEFCVPESWACYTPEPAA